MSGGGGGAAEGMTRGVPGEKEERISDLISQEMCQAAVHGTNNALVKAESMSRDRSNCTFSGVCIRSHMSPENVPFCKGTDPAIASPVGAHRRLGLDRGGKARRNDCRKTDSEGEDEGDAT